MLTPQQGQYCINRALKGMTQQDAYRGAYNAEKMNYNSIAVEACRLEDNPKVALKIQELKDEQAAEIRKENKWTRDKAFTELEWLIGKAKKQIEDLGIVTSPTATAIINSVKELNNIYEVAEESTERESDGFIEALNGKAGEVWNDETGDIPI